MLLCQSRSLASLFLAGNPIGRVGAAMALGALKYLDHVGLEGCNLNHFDLDSSFNIFNPTGHYK